MYNNFVYNDNLSGIVLNYVSLRSVGINPTSNLIDIYPGYISSDVFYDMQN